MNLNVSKIKSVPESYSSEVCKVVLNNGEEVIIKIPYNKNKLMKEYRMLKLLENKYPVAKLIEFWEGDDSIPGALLISYIDGKPAIKNIDQKLAFQMGEKLAVLHDIKVRKEEFGDMEEIIYSEKDEWWITIKQWFENCIDDCKEILDYNTLNKCIEVFNYYYKDLPEPDHPSIVHMDYRPGNILVKDSEIVGILDFESTRIGSADIDFTKMKLYVWDIFKGTKEEFLKGYRSIRRLPELDRTLNFYLLFNAFAGVSWCVKRGKTKDRFYAENMSALQEVIKNTYRD